MSKKLTRFPLKFQLKTAWLLCLTLLLSSIVPIQFADTNSFIDVENHWAKSYIDTLKPLGVINGYSDGRFLPEESIKRIEFIAIVVNALKADKRSPLQGEYWGTPFVESALNLKLISDLEYGGLTEKSLDQPITREEMASIVANAFLLSSAKPSETELEKARQSLSDMATVSEMYREQAVIAVALGIITGYKEDQTFRPLNESKRAEAAAVTYKLLTKLGVLSGTTPTTPSTTKSMNIKGITIGMSLADALKLSGQPIREDSSEYGFKWLVFHNNYKNYYMIGVENNQVVAIYATSNLIEGIALGSTKSEMTTRYGAPLDFISKGSTSYAQINDSESALYLYDQVYITAYFDQSNGGKSFAVKIINRTTEEKMKSHYGALTDELRLSYERQILDLANVYRTEQNLKVFTGHESLSNVARNHSKDMAIRKFFDHKNPSGYQFYDRITAAGLNFRSSAENIAAGYLNAFSAHCGWVNSPGHKANLIGNFDFLGVGVYFGGDYKIYYTQNFLRP